MEAAQTLEEKFEVVVGIVLNNWTALKLSLEHGQGGTPGVARDKLLSLLHSIKTLLSSTSNLDWNELADFLADFMDNEFDTLLEDASEDEVAVLICDFFKLLSVGNEAEVMDRVKNFPVSTSIFVQAVMPSQSIALNESSSSSTISSNSIVEDCEEDSEWTVVKRR